FADCFDGNPDIDEILAIKRKSEALQLLMRRSDLILNLHGGPTSLMYALMARGPRVGFEQFQYGKLYSALLPAPNPEVHSVEATMNAFRELGVKRAEAPPLRYEKHRHEAHLPSGPYVVLHPGALMETKRWEANRFAQLARALQDLGLTTVITCGPGEETVA